MIEISVTQTYTKTGKVSKSKAIVKGSSSWTKFFDRELGMKTYLAVKQEHIRPCLYERGILIEHYPNMTEEQIADKIMSDNIKTIDDMNKKPEVNGTMELKQIRKTI
ncbi:hypothetical protein KJ807_05460 [Patescibacteria group bacterium]|nr:hypothetical protein [Patescibacteria group bacterium]